MYFDTDLVGQIFERSNLVRTDIVISSALLQVAALTISKLFVQGWTKFGLSAGVGPGLSESGVTAIAEDVFLEAAAVIKTDTEKASTAGATQLNVVCRKCGGDHWTRNCPLGEEAAIGVLGIIYYFCEEKMLKNVWGQRISKMRTLARF